MSSFRTASAIALLVAQINGIAFTSAFLPHVAQQAFAHEPPQLSVNFSEYELGKMQELKKKLKKDGFDAKTIDEIFAHPQLGLNRDIPGRFAVNPERDTDSGKKDYSHYRKVHRVEQKMAAAPIFARRYEEDLREAERRYGVGKRFIVGIMGMESNFRDFGSVGAYKGVNALLTQYILTQRGDWAYKQLKELIRFSKRARKPIFSFDSSYAGAIGRPQFIPSSLTSLFVAKDKGKPPDPMDMGDSIYSVANYLARNGWNKSKNGEMPAEGSANWRAMLAYNKSPAYVKAATEIALAVK